MLFTSAVLQVSKYNKIFYNATDCKETFIIDRVFFIEKKKEADCRDCVLPDSSPGRIPVEYV